MRCALMVLIVACNGSNSSPPPASTSPTTPAMPARATVDAAVVVSPPLPVPVGPKRLHPVGVTGPFPTIDDACASAKPCGFTAIDDRGEESKPPAKPTCSLDQDPNANLPNSSEQTDLHDAWNGLELRIASQSCAVPKGLRGEEDIYYMFVKRPEGWWRSDPLWITSYNDKYGAGTMRVRWNNQQDRAFAGIAAAVEMLTCTKQGDSTTTDELMVRVERGATKPIVFAPLLVGRRYEQAPSATLPGPPDEPCPTIKTALELEEIWTSPDDLELRGSATWSEPQYIDGVLEIGANGGTPVPSNAGKYRFER